MVLSFLPKLIRDNYECYEWKHATAILRDDYPEEWKDLCEVLAQFKLTKADIVKPGGGKSPISAGIDGEFTKRGWVEKAFETKVVVDDRSMDSPTHKVDCFKNGVGVEIEWNNKDPFYDRDLNNFRLLFELRAISVGVIITRSDELQDIF